MREDAEILAAFVISNTMWLAARSAPCLRLFLLILTVLVRRVYEAEGPAAPPIFIVSGLVPSCVAATTTFLNVVDVDANVSMMASVRRIASSSRPDKPSE